MFSDEYPTPMNILLYCITHLFVIAGIVIFRENVFTAYEAKQMLWSATVYYCAAYSLIIPSVGVAFLFWAIRPNGTLSLLLYAPALWIYVLQPRVLFLPPYNTEIYLWTVQQILKNFSGGVPPVYYYMMSVHIVMFILALGSIMRPILSITRALGEETQDFVLPTGMGGKGRRLGRHTAGLPDAKWATPREVRTNFSTQGGIVLGELTDPRKNSKFDPRNPRSWKGQGKGELITLDPLQGNGHVLVTSQASGYKTSGIVIPNLLNYNGPVVVFDPKCEVYARTREARENMGFKTVVIDAEHGFNAVALIAYLAKQNQSDILYSMAKLLIPESVGDYENSKYFKDAARDIMAALLGYYVLKDSHDILGEIATTIGKPPTAIFDQLSEDPAFNEMPRFVVNNITHLASIEDRAFESTRTEIMNSLTFINYPEVSQYMAMTPKSPSFAQIIDPKTDIFLNIPQQTAESFEPMLRLLLGSFLLVSERIEVPEAPRARRLFIIDEAAKLGKMDILANIRDRGRAIGLHLMMFYQTPGEIAKIWGRPGMQSWRDGCSATIMGPVSARENADDLSTMLGKQTLRLRTKNQNTSNPVMSPFGGTVGSGETEQIRDVALLSPTEISQLPGHAAIITALGHPPIMASKAIYFTRAGMKDRVWTTDEIAANSQAQQTQTALLQKLQSTPHNPSMQAILNTSKNPQAQSQSGQDTTKAQIQTQAPTHPEPVHQATSEAQQSKEAAAQHMAEILRPPQKRVELSLDKLASLAQISKERMYHVLKGLGIPEPYEWDSRTTFDKIMNEVLFHLQPDQMTPRDQIKDAGHSGKAEGPEATPPPDQDSAKSEATAPPPFKVKHLADALCITPEKTCDLLKKHIDCPAGSDEHPVYSWETESSFEWVKLVLSSVMEDEAEGVHKPIDAPSGDAQTNTPTSPDEEGPSNIETQPEFPTTFEPTQDDWLKAVSAGQTRLGFDDWKAAQETQEPQ